MIFLAATTDLFSVISSTAATLDVNCNYIDAVTTTLSISGSGKQNTAISSATTTTVLAAPAASTTRTLKQMSIRNKHASLACDVTFQFNQNATLFELYKATLQPGQTLQYIESLGFSVLTPTSWIDRLIVMAADSVHATAATFANVTGMTQAMLQGVTYAVHGTLFHTNDASTTGSQFGYNIGAAPTAALFGEIGVVTNSVTAAVVDSGCITARDTAFAARTTGQTATGMTHFAGYIVPSADGTFALRATSEVTVAAGLTVLTGSWMRVRQQG